ncbi:hypothetical protein BK133_12465 [Paenibacillus sp. FSL H8-0548]|uniref:sulfurtransferase TusA family protein n=1 Tax=Paenibacillus sp. FSL H8-0548 TaxID=1920422 RepID=UPI00096FCA22|nr:sulfurtransferase TusA family protein [Paenibacillus sp. FSL H8-0548]OMF34600.1 hypothetical protein BK133_12465 [Paenibacillus sp. FSL H8-0548]
MTIHVDRILDAKGLACPMPIVKTKKAMDEIEYGLVLEVQATDSGSIADIQSWAAKIGHAYLGNKMDGNVIHHYLRKANPAEVTPEQRHPITLLNDDLQQHLKQPHLFEHAIIIDVREPAEYAFGHIPGAISIPLGALAKRASELDPSKDIYVICRTGNRSDMAAQALTELGFAKVTNIIPGMSEWTGPVQCEE